MVRLGIFHLILPATFVRLELFIYLCNKQYCCINVKWSNGRDKASALRCVRLCDGERARYVLCRQDDAVPVGLVRAFSSVCCKLTMIRQWQIVSILCSADFGFMNIPHHSGDGIRCFIWFVLSYQRLDQSRHFSQSAVLLWYAGHKGYVWLAVGFVHLITHFRLIF